MENKKKITLNELRSLVKKIIKEEVENNSSKFTVEKTYNEEYDCDVYTISDFSLDLGNNYSENHFTEALKNEQDDIVDYLSSNVSLSDDVIFIFKGNYGKHKESWSMSDLSDFLFKRN
jgi:hypothetical protein